MRLTLSVISLDISCHCNVFSFGQLKIQHESVEKCNTFESIFEFIFGPIHCTAPDPSSQKTLILGYFISAKLYM